MLWICISNVAERKKISNKKQNILTNVTFSINIRPYLERLVVKNPMGMYALYCVGICIAGSFSNYLYVIMYFYF